MTKPGITLFIVLVFVTACGLDRSTISEQSDQLFYIVNISPEATSPVKTDTQFSITFSRPVLPDSVAADSLFIVSKVSYEEFSADDWDALSEDVGNGQVHTVPYTFAFDSSSQVLTVTLSEKLSDQQEYVLVAVPKIQSARYYPLDQTLVGGTTKSFAGSYLVNDSSGSISSDSNDLQNEETAPLSTDSGEGQYPDVPSVSDLPPTEEETDDELDTENPEEEIVSPEIAETVFDWNRVLITEIVADPQQDHDESTQGNGVVFDDTPGVGTVGSTDEYIELFNGTDDTVDLSLWGLNMKDGTDESELLSDTSWEAYFNLDGSISNFQSGEFVVLGNPIGMINNSVTIELFDKNGDVVDEVIAEDANATDISDEAYYRDPDGDWLQGFATPGEFE